MPCSVHIVLVCNILCQGVQFFFSDQIIVYTCLYSFRDIEQNIKEHATLNLTRKRLPQSIHVTPSWTLIVTYKHQVLENSSHFQLIHLWWIQSFSYNSYYWIALAAASIFFLRLPATLHTWCTSSHLMGRVGRRCNRISIQTRKSYDDLNYEVGMAELVFKIRIFG